MSFIEEIESEIITNDHGLWVEKYRPKNLKEYIGNDLFKKKVQSFLDTNDVPNLLLAGSPGVGKSAIAKLIGTSIKCDLLVINASDENSIDTVRTKIKSFASNMGFRDLKIVLLEESDTLTFSAQAALRHICEAYSRHTRFIFTCNYPEKIIPALHSRCQAYTIIPPNKKDVAVHVSNILKTESIKATTESIAFLVNSYYPDIRKIINTAQQNSINGVLEIDEINIIENDAKLKVLEILKDTKSDKKIKFNSIRQLIADSGSIDFIEWYKFLYDNVDRFAEGHVSDVILILAESEYQAALVVDREITFMASIIQILKVLS